MALVVFLQEDEDVPSVNRNLKIFCETAPRSLPRSDVEFQAVKQINGDQAVLTSARAPAELLVTRRLVVRGARMASPAAVVMRISMNVKPNHKCKQDKSLTI